MSNTPLNKRFGRYLLLDRLDAGGMADIYIAKVTGVEQFQRLVAIKCIRPELAKNEVFAKMFIDEAKVAGQLTHANIAQIYELGRCDDQLYIAMELVDGKALRAIIDKQRSLGGTIPIAFAAYVISKVATGLDYAHRQLSPNGTPLNLVHRDVSPRNILLSFNGEVKVIDFGIVKASIRATETRTGQLKGKFSYMAPEQISHVEIDRRADIFVLGVVLFEIVAGRRLFDGNTDFDLLTKVKNVHIPDFDQALPHAPPELKTVLNKALARNPDDRYLHAADMARALEPLLIDERTIFGNHEAEAYIRELFGADIQTQQEQLRALASQCHEGDKNRDPNANNEITGSEAESFYVAFEAAEAKKRSASKRASEAGAAMGFDPHLQRDPVERKPSWQSNTFWLLIVIAIVGMGYGFLEFSKKSARSQAAHQKKSSHGFIDIKAPGPKGAVIYVYVDGKKLGPAPVLGHKISMGEHTVQVEQHRKSGRAKRRKVRVTITRTHTAKHPARVVLGL